MVSLAVRSIPGLIAAERTGRCARLIEFDPLYCDQIMRRYQGLIGKEAVLTGANMGFEAAAEDRRQAPSRAENGNEREQQDKGELVR